jgi:hypothetical protein
VIVVANAGPLIALGRIDRLDLLGGLFGFRMTPQLRREILAAAGEPFPVT